MFCFFVFLEVPRLGVESELELPAYSTATATQDPSHIFDLHHSSWQCRAPDPLIKARDGACILVNTSWIRWHCTTTGTPWDVLLSAFLSLHATNQKPAECSTQSSQCLHLFTLGPPYFWQHYHHYLRVSGSKTWGHPFLFSVSPTPGNY